MENYNIMVDSAGYFFYHRNGNVFMADREGQWGLLIIPDFAVLVLLILVIYLIKFDNEGGENG